MHGRDNKSVTLTPVLVPVVLLAISAIKIAESVSTLAMNRRAKQTKSANWASVLPLVVGIECVPKANAVSTRTVKMTPVTEFAVGRLSFVVTATVSMDVNNRNVALVDTASTACASVIHVGVDVFAVNGVIQPTAYAIAIRVLNILAHRGRPVSSKKPNKEKRSSVAMTHHVPTLSVHRVLNATMVPVRTSPLLCRPIPMKGLLMAPMGALCFPWILAALFARWTAVLLREMQVPIRHRQTPANQRERQACPMLRPWVGMRVHVMRAPTHRVSVVFG